MRLQRLIVAVLVGCAVGGCANYAGEAAQLRTACSNGDKSACIDYDAMVRSCIAPMGLFPQIGCQGIGPQTVFHPDGAALAAAPTASQPAPATVSVTTVQAASQNAFYTGTAHDPADDMPSK